VSKVILRGRAEVMGRALSMLRRTQQLRHGGVLLVEGEPGIGKSCVFSAVVDQASAMGFRCAADKADRIGWDSPAGPLLLALRSGVRPLASKSQVEQLAGRAGEPLLLLEEVSALLAAECGSDGPVLLGVDDVQWVDPLSRLLLRCLPGRLAGVPILWLFAGRRVEGGLSDDIRQLPTSVSPVEFVELGPLDTAEITAMAADRLGRLPSPGLRRMLAGVGGNPLFATQILDGAVRGTLDETGGAVPAEFVLGVHRRVREVGDAAAELLRVAAVFGAPLPVGDAVGVLAGWSSGEVLAAVDEAVRAGLLDLDGAHRLTFRHDLIREVVYAGLGAGPRRDLHGRWARYLREHGDDPVAVAAHARAAVTFGDAANAGLLAEAADRVASAMPETAGDLILAAFRALRPSQPGWFTLGRRAVELLGLVQRCSAAIEVADLLLAHLDDADAVGEIEIAVSRALWLAGRWQDAVARSAEALARPGVSGPLRARMTGLYALALSRVEPAALAGPVADEALREADRLDDPAARRLAWHALAEVTRNRAEHEESLRYYRLLRAAAGPAYIAQEILGLQHLDRFEHAATMLQAARREPGPAFLSLLYSQVWWDYHLARLAEAEAGAGTLLRLAVEQGSQCCAMEAASLLSLVALQRGEVVLARDRLNSGFGPADGDDERPAPLLPVIRGWVTAAEGDLGAAVSMLRPLVFAGREQRSPWMWKPGWLRMLWQLATAAEDPEMGREVVALAEIAAQRNPRVASLAGTARQLRGLHDRDLGVLRAGGFEDLGFALLRHDRRPQGAALLDRAWDLYHEAGAFGPMTALQDGMRQAGFRRTQWVPAVRRPVSGWEALTPAELRVARLIAVGYTNKIASKELGITVNTISTHLRSIFAKLDIRSRVQLTNIIHEHDAG
jgi:DNA-binding CsgD family transcriptional regulator